MSSNHINRGIESGLTFAERAGEPSEITVARGYVVLGFDELERALTRAIVIELRAGELAGESAGGPPSAQAAPHARARTGQRN